MKKTTKVVSLILLLLTPALVLMFLNMFGDNVYDLPVYFAKDSVQVEGKFVVTEAKEVPSFSLVDQTGKKITNENLKDQITVVDFIFTRCLDVCPTLTTQLRRVQEAFADDETVRLLSFSLDPAHDTLPVLKAFSERYRVDNQKWSFLTGQDKESMHELARKGFYLSAMNTPEDTLNPITHSPKVVLLDKKGWVRGYYDGTDRKEVDRLITEIQVLLHKYENE